MRTKRFPSIVSTLLALNLGCHSFDGAAQTHQDRLQSVAIEFPVSVPNAAKPWIRAAMGWRLGNTQQSVSRPPLQLWYVFHGDIPKYYRSETQNDRLILHRALAQRSQQAVLVYPISSQKDWGNARTPSQSHQLAEAFFLLHSEVMRQIGQSEPKVQTFSFSGGGRVDLALQRFALSKGLKSEATVKPVDLRASRAFVQNQLRAMHAGDAMVSKSMQKPNDIPDSWVRFLTAFPHIKASFVYDLSAHYPYMFDLTIRIGKGLDPSFALVRGESRTVDGGRIRFWAADSHSNAWRGQFARAFLDQR